MDKLTPLDFDIDKLDAPRARRREAAALHGRDVKRRTDKVRERRDPRRTGTRRGEIQAALRDARREGLSI